MISYDIIWYHSQFQPINLLNYLRRPLRLIPASTVDAFWRWFTAHCWSLGPLNDGPPSLANQPVQPPAQPVQPWAKSLVCHVLACTMICSPSVSSCLFISPPVVHVAFEFRQPCQLEHTGTWVFGVAEELSDFSCIACRIYIVRCCNPTTTIYQMRSPEPCIADGFAPAKKATHLNLLWLIWIQIPNPCRAHPAFGFQMLNLLPLGMAYHCLPCAWNPSAWKCQSIP